MERKTLFFCPACRKSAYGEANSIIMCSHDNRQMLSQTAYLLALAKESFVRTEYKLIQDDGRRETYYAEGLLRFYEPHPRHEAPVMAKILSCPCGCGVPESVAFESGNCAEATVTTKYACTAVGTFRLWEDQGYWDHEVEMC